MRSSATASPRRRRRWTRLTAGLEWRGRGTAVSNRSLDESHSSGSVPCAARYSMAVMNVNTRELYSSTGLGGRLGVLRFLSHEETRQALCERGGRPHQGGPSRRGGVEGCLAEGAR